MSKSSQMSGYLVPKKKVIKELYWDSIYQVEHRHIDLYSDVFELVWEYYSCKNRYYHNINHIINCHQQLDEYISNTQKQINNITEPTILRFAIWLHDIIYDARLNNNEEMSANLANVLLFNQLSRPEKESLKKLILFTKHDKIAENDDEKLISDIDLSILGSYGKDYKKYSDGIRLEYGFLPDYIYYSGRLKILENIHNKERIYYMDYFYNLYEHAAKKNIEEEIKWIKNILK